MAKKAARTAPTTPATGKRPAATAPKAGAGPNLAALDAAWGERAEAPPSTGGGGFAPAPAPDGEYIVRLSSVKVTNKKKDQMFSDGTVVPAGTPSLNHSYIIVASIPGCEKTDDSGEKPDGCRLSVFDEVSLREIMEGRTCLDIAMDRHLPQPERLHPTGRRHGLRCPRHRPSPRNHGKLGVRRRRHRRCPLPLVPRRSRHRQPPGAAMPPGGHVSAPPSGSLIRRR